ncbi:MAG: fumarylacetoacetate hydrolase family protein [Caldilineaceae bacterium]|nr:fumarylacetoacetate hydrolase family protein [Caldilineaceae bacterium]
MKIVRFIETLDGVPMDWAAPRWGLVTDKVVFPLLQAPYEEPLEEGVYAPIIDGGPIPLDDLVLTAPVTPSKIVCVGRNYADHAAELGNEVPPEPLIFLKPPSVLIGPNADVIAPEISDRVDHEGELALVIGQRCRYLAEEDAYDVIFGYSVANDVTARDLQKKDGQWTRGKGFDTFGPIGPWVDTEFTPAGRTLRVTVNGDVRQESNTDLMIYSIPRILAFVTRFMTLEPGDVVLTGTPSGVAPVQPGDVMKVEIDGLGILSNPVVGEVEARRRHDADHRN